MQKKLVLFGTGEYIIPVIKKLLPHGLDLVVTTEKNQNSPLLKFCSENNLKTISCQTSSDLINHLSIFFGNRKSSTTKYDIAVLASYGVFMPEEIVSLFPNGIINIHPSLLPKYKGPSPVQYSLLNGENVTGVTLIKLDSEIDHGPILSQELYKLQGNETAQDLLSILFEIGADMVEKLVFKLENRENLMETPQEHAKETWSYKLNKKSGFIDVSSPEFKISDLKFKIDDMIRAFYPWPGVWLKYSSDKKEQKEKSKLNGKIVKLLPNSKIQVEGKNAMNYKDFVNGFGDEGKNLLNKLELI